MIHSSAIFELDMRERRRICAEKTSEAVVDGVVPDQVDSAEGCSVLDLDDGKQNLPKE